MALVQCSSANDLRSTAKWNDFKKKYDKVYRNPSEESHRRKIYEMSLAEIEEHNKKYAAGEVTWQKGIDAFSDLTDDEFMDRMAMKRSFPELEREQDLTKFFEADPNFRNPKSFDWRDYGAVTEVKNQKSCGSCWAFGTMTSLEWLHHNLTGKLVRYSEKHMIDCDYNSGGCKGGTAYNGLRLAVRSGIYKEDDYAEYNQKKEECRAGNSTTPFKISAYGRVREKREQDILEALQKVGPLTVMINSKNFKHFKQGVLPLDDKCTLEGRGLHMVVIVGFGTQNGTDYYTLRNSWGKDWGNNGYLKVPRNVNYCGINARPYYAIA